MSEEYAVGDVVMAPWGFKWIPSDWAMVPRPLHPDEGSDDR